MAKGKKMGVLEAVRYMREEVDHRLGKSKAKLTLRIYWDEEEED